MHGDRPIRSAFNYTRDDGSVPEIYFYEPPPGTVANPPGNDPHEMPIYDGWARADDYLGALKKLGKLGGMSDEQMDRCLADDELTNGILQSRLDAQNEYQVSSTPTLVINGEVYPGSRSIDALSQLIDPLLDNS